MTPKKGESKARVCDPCSRIGTAMLKGSKGGKTCSAACGTLARWSVTYGRLSHSLPLEDERSQMQVQDAH